MNEFLNLTDVSEEVLKHVSPMRWNRLVRFQNTVVELEQHPKGRSYALARFMVRLVGGPLTEKHFAQFGRAIDHVLERTWVVGVLSSPASLALAREVAQPNGTVRRFPERHLLLWYALFPHEMDNAKLNELCGHECFVNEGAFGPPWPENLFQK